MRNCKSIFLLLFILSLFVTTTDCKKKCSEIGTLSFNTKEINIIPYNGKENLKIYKDGGWPPDTLQGTRIDEFNTITENSISGIDNQDCKGDYYMVEYNKITFISIGLLAISLDLDFDNPFISKGVNKYLNITIGTTFDPLGLFFNRIPLKNDSIVVNDSTVFYHNNLSVGTKQFISVYELHLEIPSSSEIKRVYYTLNNGIVAYIREGTVFYVDRL